MKLVQQSINFDQTLDAMQRDAHGPRLGVFFKGPPITGDELKEEGMSKVMRKKLAREYRDRLVECLKVFPVRSRITIENLTGIVGRPPKEISSNAVGPAVSFMIKKGMLCPTGKMLKPGRKERHANRLPEYEVLRYS